MSKNNLRTGTVNDTDMQCTLELQANVPSATNEARRCIYNRRLYCTCQGRTSRRRYVGLHINTLLRKRRKRTYNT